jgi:hypothetical protein
VQKNVLLDLHVPGTNKKRIKNEKKRKRTNLAASGTKKNGKKRNRTKRKHVKNERKTKVFVSASFPQGFRRALLGMFCVFIVQKPFRNQSNSVRLVLAPGAGMALFCRVLSTNTCIVVYVCWYW